MIGLYVHIPFCVKKCHYCDFVVTTTGGAEVKNDFLDALEKEVIYYSPQLRGKKFDTVYLGGGTPSTLDAVQIWRVFSILRGHFSFRSGIEITCEVNPGDLNEEKAGAYRELGINRISLGAQSFHDDTLKRINRAHGSREIYQSFALLRREGFKNINMDLILSLPGETLKESEHSLRELKRLDPDHVSIYELTIEEKTVFGEQFKKGALKLPDEEEELQILSFAREFLKQSGYLHYELLNYAKPGFQSRHNCLYWANEATLGLGPGAFSYLDGRRFRNSFDVDEYLRKIKNGDWSASEEETLTPEKKETESFLLSLRLLEGSDLGRFRSVKSRLGGALSGLMDEGLLTNEGGKVRLTGRGQFFAETVFAELSAPC